MLLIKTIWKSPVPLKFGLTKCSFNRFILITGILLCLILSFQSTNAKDTNNAIVHATHVNIRTGPSLKARIVGKIVNKGTPIEIIIRHKNWYFIHYDIFKKGWIYADFVTLLFKTTEIEPTQIEQIIQDIEKISDKSISGRAFFDLGVFAFEEGDYPNAITYLTKAIQLNPVVPEFYHYLGKTYLETKNYELSEKHLNRAWKMASSLSDIQKDRAILYYKQSRYQDAVNLFLDIIRHNPSDIMSTYYAANCLYKQSDYYQAGQLFQKAAKKSPSLKANCLYYAGICQIKTGLPHKARQYLMQVQNSPKAGILKEYASKWIAALDKNKAIIKKPYSIFVQMGYQYDSNIRMEPIDEDLYTDEDDFCTSFLFSGNYTVADAQPYQVSAGLVYFKYLYNEYTQFNMDGSMIHLNSKLDLDSVKIGLNMTPSIFWLDSKQYLKRFSINPTFSFRLKPQLTAIVSYANILDNNLDNDDRDACQIDNELTLQYVIPRKNLLLFSSVRLEMVNADNIINDYDRIISKAGLRLQKLWGCTLGFSGVYEQKKYKAIDPAYDALRDDYKAMGLFYIHRPILSHRLGMKTEFKFSKNSSNINIYNYERSSVTFSLTANR